MLRQRRLSLPPALVAAALVEEVGALGAPGDEWGAAAGGAWRYRKAAGDGRAASRAALPGRRRPLFALLSRAGPLLLGLALLAGLALSALVGGRNGKPAPHGPPHAAPHGGGRPRGSPTGLRRGFAGQQAAGAAWAPEAPRQPEAAAPVAAAQTLSNGSADAPSYRAPPDYLPFSILPLPDAVSRRSPGVDVAVAAELLPPGGPYALVHSAGNPATVALQSSPPFLTLPLSAYAPDAANPDRAPFAPLVPLRSSLRYLRGTAAYPVVDRGPVDDAFFPRLPDASTPVTPVTPSGVAVAYILLCHDLDSALGAGEFMDAVYTHPNLTRFYVHLDAKAAPAALLALHGIAARFPAGAANLVYPRVRVDWGAASMVRAELLALRAAETSWAGWRFAVVASGTSYPSQPPCEREKWLSRLDPRANIVFYDRPWKVCRWGSTRADEHCKKQRGRCLDPSCSTMSHTPGGAPVYKGPQWVLLSREFAYFAANSHRSRLWLAYFESGSHASDEMFFPTLLMDSPFNGTSQLAPGPFIHVVWNSERRNGCLSRRSTAPWGWSPCTLGTNDLPGVVRSRAQFARKFAAGDPAKRVLRGVWARACAGEPVGDLLAGLPDPGRDDGFALPWTWRERAYQARNLVIWGFDSARDAVLGWWDQAGMRWRGEA
ncbi:core-2/I-branching enzyme-domain-containing protein [Hyaloraphidium curvatum]|nr:core-2/I-branching enzyme-domain-containing protein [Hyaloraphidium curvatum]